MPNEEDKLSHSVWEGKYHIVLIPKCRRKRMYEDWRRYLGAIFQALAQQRECNIVEGHVCVGHAHMLVESPPKYSGSQVVRFIKGKSAIATARNFMGRRKNFTGQQFWARGYYVSTVGRNEELIREYIQQPEKEDHRLEQLTLFKE